MVGAGNRLLSDGVFDYSYDAEGRLVREESVSTGEAVEYAWDSRGQLVEAVFKDAFDAVTKRVAYQYDALGRKIGKQVDDDGDNDFDRATRYVYDSAGKADGNGLGGLDDVVLVFDDSGSLTNRYLHGSGVDEILADEDALNEVLWGLADHLGTVRDLARYDAGTDTTSIASHRAFDSFGNLLSETDPATSNPISPASAEGRFLYQFTGREYDADVQLHYYRARWYHARLGRFLTEDPLSFAAGDTNLGRYVGNGPTHATDPSGLEKLTKEMVDKSREEMRALGLDSEEIRFRLAILKNVYYGKVYFPDPDNDLPESRNKKFWKESEGGYYVPKGRPTAAINDLWESSNGIQCNKYSALIAIKAHIDLADERRRQYLDRMLSNKVIPDDLEDEGFGTFFTDPKPKNSHDFSPSELIPGDQIWFENPYFNKLKPKYRGYDEYRGEQGSNVYYLGNGMVIGIYGSHEVLTIREYQEKMLGWNVVREWNRTETPAAVYSDFRIRSCRRAIAP